MKINNLLKIFNEYAPTSLSDRYVLEFNAYDNVGVIVDTVDDITGVLFSLDLTSESIDLAIKNGCNLIFTHHPAIYSPIKRLTADMPVFKAVKNSIGVISFHLNLDVAKFGIDYYLAKGLGAQNAELLEVLEEGIGYGRIFELKGQTLGDLASGYKTEFKTDKIVVYGSLSDSISKVATLCGAGLDENALNNLQGVDVIVSSDVPHHVILKALEMGKRLIVASHYSSEAYGFSKVFENLKEKLGVKAILNIENKYL